MDIKIYLIDDDEVCLQTSALIFTESRYTKGCSIFLDPREALAVLKQDIENNSLPDIIILDLHIPVMSGWDFLEALKPYEAQLRNDCFIYVLTSSIDESELMQVQTFPLVFDVIQKPFTPDKLNQIIQEIVFMKTK
ncbi:MAG TPA: response regulator [Adhaeribacter sp.]|nr:response regulator [Adhaeribacter sp.]